jgi:signal transduction histidine kinase
MLIRNWLDQYILNAGIKPSDSVAKTRAIKISNAIGMTAIANCLIFGLYFLYLGDTQLLNACVFAGVLYILAHVINYSGHTILGRVFLLTSGNYIIFYFACAFRGEANFQFFLFSLSASTFMNFSWEERKYFSLIILPVFFLFIGDYYQWEFFEATQTRYDQRMLRFLSMAAPFFQITMGFFYFLKQSVRFETESNENLRKLEIEHSKQIQVQKMSSLGEMAGGVAHEINNPLMVIIGTTYNLKKILAPKLPQEDPVFAKIEKIDSMVHRIVGIIKALKNISRNSENDPAERTSVHSVINSTLDLCKERFAKHSILLEILGDETLEIDCRPTEISQVLLNLLNNAFDATLSREGARVSIRTKKIANKIEITVEDNGHGIPMTILDKIMQPFFSTKEIGQGTGLGLSISKGLIESHKGTLTCIPGAGKTIFQIHLPEASN